MCRHAAYLGTAISLQQFLLDPPHSLYRQSWDAQELKYARLNADGYGFGWFDAQGTPSAYTSSLPIWSDGNLPSLARSLQNRLWVGEVRSATAGSPVHQYNTQPFCDERWLFVHNGYIRKFHEQVRPALSGELAPEFMAGIQGNTDSEYLFAVLRQLLHKETSLSPADVLRRLFDQITGLAGSEEALLNIIITDGTCLYATRHAINHECPTLYYTINEDAFPGGRLIASERFSKHDSWQAVPEHHLLVLRESGPPELLAI